MSFESTVSYSGQNINSTLDGSVAIEQGRGRAVIYNEGLPRTVLDVLGLTTIRTDGTYAVRAGQDAETLSDGVWVAKPSEDLRELIDGE